MIKVCKFGGTSLADGTNFRRVAAILESDPTRRYVVVSAPGKRYGADTKITDLLYEAYRELKETGAVGEAFGKVSERFRGIVRELGLNFPIDEVLCEVKRGIEAEKSADFAASRGEYLCARIMANFLGVPFIDARDVIKFTAEGKLDSERSYALVRETLIGKKRAVIAGFYGETLDGKIKTFSRGGSDISGAIVARAVMANVYENWTDTSGFLACDPRIVTGAKTISSLSYKELRELSYMGANVLHSDSIFPVRDSNIPIVIKNTFRPEDEGTEILPVSKYRFGDSTVTGVAGKQGFTVLVLEKQSMNAEAKFIYKVLSILLKHGVPFEHVPSGIDTISVVIPCEGLDRGVLDRACEEIRKTVLPDAVHIHPNITLIAVVGHGLRRSVGASARVFDAIGRAGVNVRMIEGASELNILIGVDDENYERTVRAVYEEFFTP